MSNPLRELARYGQSVWYDYIRRALIESGDLKKLIDEDGLSGVTSNPSIFEKAIAGSTDYDRELEQLAGAKGLDAKAIFERLAIEDVQAAADLFRPTYEATRRADGYVSLEVAPTLARDTAGTIEEARRLWKAIARENAMIKVPATPAGIPAIQALIGEGININVTLLFARDVYEQVADAYIRGLEALAQRGGDVSRVASVASFFVSRIDTVADALLTERLHSAQSEEQRQKLKSLLGKVAIANAKLAYQRYKEIRSGTRFAALAGKGARPQRLLWASTSAKNPSYRDVYYVEELIGPETIDTVPPSTLTAFRDHGQPRPSLEEGVPEARRTLQELEQVGISLKQITDQTLQDGVRLFAESFAKLLDAVEQRRRANRPVALNALTYQLAAEHVSALSASLEDWLTHDKVRRLWNGDASLWTGKDEAQWLGWLRVTEGQLPHLIRFQLLANEVRSAGFKHVLLLGMGGSSLCPDVLRTTFGSAPGFPELLVLDSTVPAQIRSFERRIDSRATLFIVSSKSGTTLEPNNFKQYFFERVKSLVGPVEAGKRFIAITDPGSQLESVAEADRFAHIFHGLPSIGGRYSALSDFGMIPAAAIGLDVANLVEEAEQMVHACSFCVPPKENAGVLLGAILGVLGNGGRDKVTLVASPRIASFGAWVEQLLAESTGKQGRGLIPVDGEPLGSPDRYGNDRLFVYLRLTSAVDPDQDAAVDTLARAGQPVVRISLDDPADIAQEFFRWEFATAVAGSILGINPFDQPDVEASKIETRKLTEEYERTGSLPPEVAFFEEGGLRLFADAANAEAIGRPSSLAAALRTHLSRVRAGDYFALLAYLEMNDENRSELQSIRQRVRDQTRAATCLGFGPRFLHSTGQAYKGGPNTGVFLQVTSDDREDLLVPGKKYSFGIVKAAQARGDFEVLSSRGRRALRVHIRDDVRRGLGALSAAVAQALR